MNQIPWGRILAILAVLAAGVLLGGAIVQRHYEPQLTAANQKIGALEHAYLTLAEATGRQNAAIDALEQQGRARADKAAQAVQQAHGEAQDYYRRGEAILGLKRPPSADPCRSASAEFDAELQRERNKP